MQTFVDPGHTIGGQWPHQFFAYLIILRFEKLRPSHKNAARLKSNILAHSQKFFPNKFWVSYATGDKAQWNKPELTT